MIKVNPERADLIETRVIDGRQCLVIAVDDHIEVNGVNVRTLKRKKAQKKRNKIEHNGIFIRRSQMLIRDCFLRNENN